MSMCTVFSSGTGWLACRHRTKPKKKANLKRFRKYTHKTLFQDCETAKKLKACFGT